MAKLTITNINKSITSSRVSKDKDGDWIKLLDDVDNSDYYVGRLLELFRAIKTQNDDLKLGSIGCDLITYSNLKVETSSNIDKAMQILATLKVRYEL